MLRLALFAAIGALLFPGAPAPAATFTIAGHNADYELGENALAGGSTATTVRIGATSATPGGKNAVLIFALPALAPGDRLTGAQLTFTYPSKSGTPAFHADLWGLGFPTSTTALTTAYLENNTDPAAASDPTRVKLHDNLLAPATPVGGAITSATSALTAYLDSFYAAHPAYPGGHYVFLRLNADADPGNSITGYNVATANHGTVASRPVLTLTTAHDALTFGDAASEAAHALTATLSTSLTGALGQPARQLLPTTPATEAGGTLTFTLACHPSAPTYLTLKLWGGDAGAALGRLYLYDADGRQIGYRHQGDIDPLNIASDLPLLPGRFFYHTLPLPLALTQGRTSVTLSIRAFGRIWPYGTTYDTFQRTLTGPSRALYRVFSHLPPAFTPPADDPQGTAPADAIRPAPDEAARLAALKTTVNNRLHSYATAANFPDLLGALCLAQAWHLSWTNQYHSGATVARVQAMIDDVVRRQALDPATVAREPKWRSFGPAGYATWLLRDALAPSLDTLIDHDGDAGAATPALTRRAAWSSAFQASLAHRRRDRRMYANQAMISDLNLYLSHLGLRALDPAAALPESAARRYLHEAVGLEPWRGSDHPVTGEPTWSMGAGYYVVTPQGLTKETGYVGGYGEVLDWVAQLYQATRADGSAGDADLRAQAILLQQARAPFRLPWVDAGGYRSMSLQSVIGWRDSEYPDDGGATYGARNSVESSAVRPAALLQDATSVGFAKQHLLDQQFWSSLDTGGALTNSSTDSTLALLGIPDDLATVRALPDSGVRLPNSPGRPDYVWTDDENGVVVIRRGSEIVTVALYWRANFGVNALARIHVQRPGHTVMALARTQALYLPSGGYHIRDQRTGDFASATYNVPGVSQALAGERLPLPSPPSGLSLQTSASYTNPYNGRAAFHHLRYGAYLIAQNTTADRTFPVQVPAGFSSAVDLVTGQTRTAPLTVGPHQTVVLLLSAADAAAALPPPVPAWLDATGTATQVALTWPASPGATSYTVQRAGTAAGPFTVLATGLTAPAFTDTSVSAAAPYVYSVTAIGPAGESYPMTSAPTSAGLPAPWVSQDIGAVGLAGHATHASGAFTVRGAGTNLAGNADAFHFASQPVAGDVVFQARLASRLIGRVLDDKVGLMLRETSAAGAKNFLVFLDAQQGRVRTSHRTGTGSGTTVIDGPATTVVPQWLRLERQGSVLRGYHSLDGATWVLVGSATVPMGAAVQAGFAVCSRNTDALNVSTFDQVVLSPLPGSALEAWRLQHFGTIAATGDAADVADPEADGLVNLLEYALGSDPHAPSPDAVTFATSAPGLSPADAAAPHPLALTFHRIADPALTYTVQAADDLGLAWSDLWTSTGAANLAGPVTVTDALTSPAQPRRFLRLRVSL